MSELSPTEVLQRALRRDAQSIRELPYRACHDPRDIVLDCALVLVDAIAQDGAADGPYAFAALLNLDAAVKAYRARWGR